MSIPYVVVPALLDDQLSARATPSISISLDKSSHLSLDLAGVAGLMGGDDAVSAMVAVHVYGNRRWLGWYNTPGSFQIAKRFCSFANSPSPRTISSPAEFHTKNVHTDPTRLLGSENNGGPKFRAAHSGTVIQETSHMAALFMKACAALGSEGKVVPGRVSRPVEITIADLGQAPAPEMRPAYSSASMLLFASVPIATSVCACMLCAFCGDWYATSLILVGIVASGISCFVLGSADLVFTHPEPAKGSPAGDGILSSDSNIVLLRGTEGAVNSITRGRFSLRFSSQAHYNLISRCSLLFFIQCFAQLFLIPQASLFGQVMFLTSFGVSALYNAWLSSMDKEELQQRLLLERVLEGPTVTKYRLGTRTAAVVFTLLVLRSQDPTGLLNELLPSDTKVWRQWKATILGQLRHPDDGSFLFDKKVGDFDEFTQEELDLLERLYDDAQAAYDGYNNYRRAGPL